MMKFPELESEMYDALPQEEEEDAEQQEINRTEEEATFDKVDIKKCSHRSPL